MRVDPRVPVGVIAMAAGLVAASPRLHAQALQTGMIAGTVTVPAGESAKGIAVTLDTGQATTTDEHGYFVFTSVLPGPHTISASLVGYEAAEMDNVIVTQELTATVDLTLTERQATSLGQTTARVSMLRKDVPSSLYTVTADQEQLVRTTPENLYMYPGAAASQPGVIPDPNGLPTIRGGRQFNTGYMLDGILLTQPSSGEFATNLVTVGMGRMNVYTGGMRADLGGAAGGFINSVVKNGAAVRGGSIETSAGSLAFANLVAEAGDVEKNGLNWYAATNLFRTDVKGSYMTAAIPASADGVVKLIQPFGDKDRLTFLGTSGYERYDVPLFDPLTGEEFGAEHDWELDPSRLPTSVTSPTSPWRSVTRAQDYLNQQHHLGSLTWAHSFSPSSTLSAQVYGWRRLKDVNGMSDWNITDTNVNDRLGAADLGYTNQISETLQLRLGGSIIKGDNYDRRAQRGLPGTGRGAVLRLRDADTTDVNGYAAITAKPLPRLTADLGVHYGSRAYDRKVTDDEIGLYDILSGMSGTNPTGLTASQKATAQAIQEADRETLAKTGRNPRYEAVSPRLGLTYALQADTVLKASVGQYAQFSPGNYIENRYLPITMTNGGGNPYYYPLTSRKVFDVGPEKVTAWEFGVEHQFGNSLALAVTPYWRNTDDMIARDPGQPGRPFTNAGHGHTRGVETKLTMREHNGWSGWLSYTYQVARANVASQATDQTILDPDREFRMDFDQRHTVYLVGRYRKNRFEVNPMLELGSGYPWGGRPDLFGAPTGYGFSPDGEDLLPILVNGRVQGDEVNPFNTGWHKNLSVTFRLYTDDSKSSYYFLQVQNVLNSQDVTQKYWQNPFTGNSNLGYVPGEVSYTDENGKTQTSNGHFEYKPWSRVPPIFVLVGVRKTF